MLRQSKILMLAVVFGFTVPVHGDYLTVSKRARVKEDPVGDSHLIAYAEIGDVLFLAEDEQTNGYYAVDMGSSGVGWVYRTLVRRRSGVPEDQVAPPYTMIDAGSVLNESQRRWAGRHLRLGKPQAFFERVKERYVVGFDSRMKIPMWVQYELSRDDLDGDQDRTDNFRVDYTIPAGSRSELEDYAGSGYDRGHMAPADDMVASRKVMSESFLLSNMAPQLNVGFNGGIWRVLEEAVRDWVLIRGELTVIVGPVFRVSEEDRVEYGVIGENDVAVPTSFFKIVSDCRNVGSCDVLAFIIPHEDLTDRSFADYLVSVDEIEAATGLDFLSALPDATEAVIEAEPAASIW